MTCGTLDGPVGYIILTLAVVGSVTLVGGALWGLAALIGLLTPPAPAGTAAQSHEDGDRG